MLEHSEKLNRIQHIVEQVAKKQREYAELQRNKNLFKNFVDVVFILITAFFTSYLANIFRDSAKG